MTLGGDMGQAVPLILLSKYRRDLAVSYISIVAIGMTCSCSLRGERGEGSVFLTNEYFLHKSSVHDVFVAPQTWDDLTPRIPPKVTHICVSGRFVLAVQQPLRTDGNKRSYPSPHPADEAKWILDTRNREVFGPLTVGEFEKKLTECGIGREVSFKTVDEFMRVQLESAE